MIPANLSLLLNRITKNKHTSIAGSVVLGGELVSGLIQIWCPQYQAQVDASVKLVQKCAIAYGFVMAGDAGAPPPPPKLPAETDQPKTS